MKNSAAARMTSMATGCTAKGSMVILLKSGIIAGFVLLVNWTAFVSVRGQSIGKRLDQVDDE